MPSSPTLQLDDFALSQNDAKKLAFIANGHVIQDGAALPDVPPFRLSIGQAVTVPDEVKNAFAEHDIVIAEADFGLALHTVNDAIAQPVWYGSFTSEGVDLFGVQDLADNALVWGDPTVALALADLQLRVALQVRGLAVQRALVVVAGHVKDNLALGPVQVDGLDVRFGLHIDIAGMAALGDILDDPAAILDGAFTGRFGFRVTGKKLIIAQENLLAIDNATMAFDIAVSSPAGVRTLELGDVAFSLLADEVTVAGAQIRKLDLACGYEAAAETVYLRGSADTILPALCADILDPAYHPASAALKGGFDFIHSPDETRLDLVLDHLYLDPAINILEMSARDMRLGFHYDHTASSWQLKLRGVMCQSWSRLAQRMSDYGIVRLPRGDGLPDLQGTLDFALSDSGSKFDYRLDFLQPETGCREGVAPVPFTGAFGPLPVALAESYVEARFEVDGANYSWSFSGAGVLSTTDWLHDGPLPVDKLTFIVEAHGESTETPELLFKIDSDLPKLTLPPLLPDEPGIAIFELQTLAVVVGDQLAIDGTAIIRNPADIATELGLPPESWGPLLQPISDLLTGMAATLAVRVPITSDDPATLTLMLVPVGAPTFRLMDTIAIIVAAGQPAEPRDDTRQIDGSKHEFFEVQPGKIEFAASFGESISLALSLSFNCKVFGETFDLTALLRLVDGEPEFLAMAGLTDPIRLAIPGIKPEDVLGSVTIRDIRDRYNLDHHMSTSPMADFTSIFPYATPGDAQATLEALETLLRDLFAMPGVDTSLVFEIRNFGLSVRLDQAPSISGTVRLVQLPGFLDSIMPENGFDFGLGCSAQRIFISVKGPAADEGALFAHHTTPPLFSIPLGQANGTSRWVHLYFGRFELEYAWVTNAFGFVLDAAVIPEPADLFDFNVAGSGLYIPAQKTFIKLSKMISTGPYPIIIPEWAISFKREGIGVEVVETAADEMGVQYYLGNPFDTDERFATYYFRETRFSPTYYIMQPGLVLDGGIIIGSHRPRDFRYDAPNVLPPQRYDELFGDFGKPGNKLRAHVEINNWQFVLLSGGLGLMLNPLAIFPGTPVPPFWIWPPHLMMGDVFADRISLAVNVPHVLFFSVDFRRPLPTLSLQGMMELVALAMTGFSETIPHTSELRKVYYATLDIRAELPLLQFLTGATPALAIALEANIVDVVNGIIRLGKAAQETIADGTQLLERLQGDPSLLVRMIPAQARRFELDVVHDVLRFAFSGSLYVLTPDEFEEELILYHENKRARRGLAASNPHGARGNLIGVSAASGPAPHAVDFTIGPTGGAVIAADWEFGDGATSSSATPTHTYTAVGRYTATVRLTVSVPTDQGHVEQEIVASIAVTAEGPAVNGLALQLVDQANEQFTYIVNPLAYFDPDETPFQRFLGRATGEAFRRRQQDVVVATDLRSRREAAVAQFVRFAWGKLAETRIDDRARRAGLLRSYGLEGIAPQLEQIIRAMAPPSLPISLRINQLPPAIVHAIEEQFLLLAHAELAKPFTVIAGLERNPHDLAAAIVQDTVIDKTTPVFRHPGFRITLPTRLPAIGPAPLPTTPGVGIGGGGTVPGDNSRVTITANPTTGDAPLTVQFSATVTSAHAVAGYAWSFGGGPTSTADAPSHTYARSGTYTATVQVTLANRDVITPESPKQIEVTLAPLIVEIAAEPGGGTAPLTVQFSVQTSTSAVVTGVTWSFGDGATSAAANPTHTYASAGAYVAAVTVTASDGRSESADVAIAVDPPQSVVAIVNARARLVSYQSRLPRAIVSDAAAAIEDCFAPWIDRVNAGTIDTAREAATLRRALTDCIAAAIVSQYTVITDDLNDTAVLDVTRDVIRGKLVDALATQPAYQTDVRVLTLYDARRTLDLLADHVATEHDTAPGIDSAPEIAYAIRCRPDFVPAGANATLATVPNSSPLYNVTQRAGSYTLLVAGQDPIPLDAWVADGIPPSPRSADLVRARLSVEQVVVQRPLTAAEQAYARHAFVEQNDLLYQQSIFARPEYTIRDEGGIHGPLSLADLLHTAAGYIVPGAPVWLSGFKLELLGNEIGMVGMLAAPDNIFLHGYHELKLEWGDTSLDLKGEFHLIAGEMWEAALAGNGEFAANSLHFSGMATFRHGGNDIFKGQATGAIAIPGPGKLPVFDLTVAFEYHDSWTLKFGNTELIKVTMDAAFDMAAKIDPNATDPDPQFTLNAQGELGVAAHHYAVPKLKDVVIAPATTVCTPVPIIPVPAQVPYFTTECVTVPAVVAKVPDLSDLTRETMELKTGTGLTIEVSDSGNKLALSLHMAAELGTVTVDETLTLTTLLNG